MSGNQVRTGTYAGPKAAAPRSFRPIVSMLSGLLIGSSLSTGVALAAGSTSSAPATVDAAFLKAEHVRVEGLLQSEAEQRRQDRFLMQGFFEEAHESYPRIPAGVLEAMAYTGSRWIHRIPEAPQAGHHNMPQVYGVMGLHHGVGGFADVLSQAAAAKGWSVEHVMQNPRAEILATAALLDKVLSQQGLSKPSVEELVPALEQLSGLPGGNNVKNFARLSYVYDVLLTLERGVDDWGIRIPSMSIDWGMAFSADELKLLRSPLVHVDVTADKVSIADALDTRAPDLIAQAASASATEKSTAAAPASTDYAPALWVASPNYSSRSGTAITHVAIHTVQGSYSSCISWFQNTSSQVSAHYVVRSSDGQVTQMVREADKAWHIGSENPYTLGTEHEGYVDTGSYYTTAMYNSTSALTKDMCTSNKIDCNTCYPGPSQSDVAVQSQSYKIKGHQHFPNQTHNDPGLYWDWPKFKGLISTGGTTTTGTTTILDNFEASEGHFNTDPTYSGSTVGISTSSTAVRSTSAKKNGSYSEGLTLVDSSASTSSWQVRFLSGSGTASQNTAMKKAGGRVGVWVYTATSGITVSFGIDDTDGTERSVAKSVPTSTWTYLEWKLDDQTQWDAWSGGNGVLDNTTSLTIDAIWFFRANSSSQATIYIDDVTYRTE